MYSDVMKQRHQLITLRGKRSRAEIATAIGISENYVGRLERGERGISLRVAVGFRDLYDIPVDAWLYEDKQ